MNSTCKGVQAISKGDRLAATQLREMLAYKVRECRSRWILEFYGLLSPEIAIAISVQNVSYWVGQGAPARVILRFVAYRECMFKVTGIGGFYFDF